MGETQGPMGAKRWGVSEPTSGGVRQNFPEEVLTRQKGREQCCRLRELPVQRWPTCWITDLILTGGCDLPGQSLGRGFCGEQTPRFWPCRTPIWLGRLTVSTYQLTPLIQARTLDQAYFQTICISLLT